MDTYKQWQEEEFTTSYCY